jgi:chorismate synthase
MQNYILEAKEEGDSVGGCVECAIYGVPAGVGNPLFDGIENRISSVIFGIGGVRGIEFGTGFDATLMRGSENNDEFYIEDDAILTKTNNHGGVLGGITTGMPIVFKTAFKPTPSISKMQKSVSFSKNEHTELSTEGRHDPCIAIRAVPCVEAAVAIAIADFVL